MKTLRLIFRVVSLSLLLASCGGGGGDDAPAGVAVVSTAGIELLAGGVGGAGNRDATGTDSRFYQPFGIAVAADGTRYIADNLNHTIRKVSPAGVVTTLAGKAGVSGDADGTGSVARFSRPAGIALAADGTLYVSDSGNFTIRAITAAGEVSTLAGLAGTSGMVDATGSEARLGSGAGLVVASDGNIYFCDVGNRVIRKVTPGGVVSSVAGLAGWSGNVDGTGTEARFNEPMGITVDGNDVLYVADASAHTIRRVTLAGEVTTWAGGAGSSGLVNATGSAARFSSPFGVVAEADGTLYVADAANSVVRKISPAAEVTTLASLVDVPAAGVALALPVGIGRDGSGNLWVTDANNQRVLSVTAAGVVTPALGAAPLPGSTDGTGAAARFLLPFGLAVASDGRTYVADTGNHIIRVISTGGAVTTLAGTAGVFGGSNGTGAAARFNLPSGIAVDDAGTVYLSDTGNHAIRKITSAGVVTTLAGTLGAAGSTDGLGATARFNQPIGLALDRAGNLYVADAGNYVIRKVTPTGQVTTFAGKAGNFGAVDATGSDARFRLPVGVAVAADGTVYVSDQENQAIRKITPAGEVTTLAGSFGVSGDSDGTGSAARFNFPGGIGVAANGTVYVADYANHLLRTVSAAGDVATLAGVSGAAGVVLGDLPGGLNQPQGLALGVNGELYLTSENSVLKVTPASPIQVFDLDLTGSATSLIEGQSLTLTWGSRDATNCQASGAWSGAQASSGSTSVTVGAAGTYTYTLTCDENGGPGSTSDSVTVTVVAPTPLLSLVGSSAFVAPGNPFTLTWTGTSVTSCTASGSWSGARATSGSETLTPAAGSQSYTLTCTGSGGSVSRTVTVSVAPPPVVTLTASATTVKEGKSFTLTWSATNATSCLAAGGGWSGARATSGSETFTPASAGVVSYTLSCSGSGGSKITGVTITTTASGGGGGGSSSGGGGGGGGALDAWALLALGGLLLGRRRA